MQLSRARFLSTASTTHHGASGIFGFGVLLPAAARLHVHRAQLPLLERIVDAHQEAELLLFIRD
jgi:hypothetical protein